MKSIHLPLLALGLVVLGGALQAQTVSTDKSTYVVGERVLATFDSSTTTTDWVGIYEAGASHGSGYPSIYWQYTNGEQTPGSSVIPAGTLNFLPFSLPPGDYDCRYFANDVYTLLDQVTFAVIAGSTSPAPPPTGELTVMSFNIWVNASNVSSGLVMVKEAIVKAQPDIIGLQECNASTLNSLLGLLQTDPHYAQAQGSGATSIISRYPILAEYTSGGLYGYGVRVDLPSGQDVRFFNSHLTAYPYGPYTVRDGGSQAQVLADEQATRLAEAQAILSTLIDAPQHDPDLPTFFVGDHNCPSGLDWTAANSDQNFGWTFDWPVASLVSSSGFLDLYREVHPDPVAQRGLTWSPGYPKGTLATNDVHDRIDMVYFRPAPGVTPQALQAYTFDEDPWPTDHRAVVVSLVLDAGPGTPYCFGDPGSGTPCPCGNDNDGSVQGSGCANGAFTSGSRMTGSGVASLALDTLVLHGHHTENSQFGLYFQADNSLDPGIIWGDGLRCTGGDLRRLGTRVSDGSGYSDTSGYAYTISERAGNISAGDTKRYQLWYRNTAGSPCGAEFNTSNGYEITWLP